MTNSVTITNKFIKMSNQSELTSEQILGIVERVATRIRRHLNGGVNEAIAPSIDLLSNQDISVNYQHVDDFVVIRLDSTNTKYSITYSFIVDMFKGEPKLTHVALSVLDYKNVWGRTEILGDGVKIYEEEVLEKKSLIEGVRVKQTARHYYGEDILYTNLIVSFNGLEVMFSYT